MIKDFNIHLTDNQTSWYSGQNFTGIVHFRLEQSQGIQGVLINFLGVGVVSWNIPLDTSDPKSPRSSLSSKATQDSHHEATEVYIDDEHWLLGDGVNSTTLAPGEHNYQFDIQLPVQLPASFDNERGTVEYELSARLYVTGQDQHQTASIPVTVLGYLDLSFEPGALQPAVHSATETFRCCCTKGKLIMTVQLYQIGHICLDTAKFEVELENHSDVTVESIEATLLQHVKYFADGSQEDTLQVVCSTYGPPVFPRTTMAWTEPNLIIPHLVPTRLGGKSKLIDVQYILQFSPTVDARCASVPTVDVPIIIGTPQNKQSMRAACQHSPGRSSITAIKLLPGIPREMLSKFVKQRRKKSGKKSATKMIWSAGETIADWPRRNSQSVIPSLVSQSASLRAAVSSSIVSGSVRSSLRFSA